MEWIKCSKKHPKHEQIVIAYGFYSHPLQGTRSKRSVHACQYFNWNKDSKFIWSVLDENCCARGELTYVTRWMPLPEEPKE